MMKKTIPLFGVVNLPEMEAIAIDVLRSGRIASGEYVNRFEAGISQIVGQPDVVSTLDMTSAIFLALHLAGVKDGDEVLTTAFACLSTNAAIAQCGAIPVWVDVTPQTVEIDVSDLVSKLTDRTRAVILYHVAGYPGPAQEIATICHQRGIALIEDCDNALFAYRDGMHVGSHGDFAVYSFYPNRQINATEGGALVCKSPDMAARARKLRRFGIDAATFRNAVGEVNPASDIPEVGWAFTMNNLCAALAWAQLPTAASRVNKARGNVERLSKTINDLAGIRLVSVPFNAQPAYWVILLWVNNRDAVLRVMKDQGVHVSSVHHRNDIYSGFKSKHSTNLPNTTYIQDHILAIPCGWWLSETDLNTIADALRKASSTVRHQ